MALSQDEQIYDIWENRWKGSQTKERLSLLGKQMFKSKRVILTKSIKDLDVKTFLEVGCGLGHTFPVFQEAGLDCSGIDVSPEAVEVCKKKGFPVLLKKVEDVTEQYDLIFSDGMLEHFLYFEPFVQHFIRISRNYVMIIQPNHDSFVGKSLAFLSELIRGNENVFEYNYRIKDFIEVFERNGCKLLKSEPIFADCFRLLLFKKTE